MMTYLGLQLRGLQGHLEDIREAVHKPLGRLHSADSAEALNHHINKLRAWGGEDNICTKNHVLDQFWSMARKSARTSQAEIRGDGALQYSFGMHCKQWTGQDMEEVASKFSHVLKYE